MEAESALQIIAEVAVGLAGFSGVVAAFHRRSDDAWGPIDVMRFRIMLGTSLTALLLSLLPFALHHIGLSSTTTWATCSAAFALYIAIVVPLDVRRGARIGSAGDPEFRQSIAIVIGSLLAGVFLLQVLNVLEIGFNREVGPFVFGLVVLVGVCAFMFLRLLSFVGRQ